MIRKSRKEPLELQTYSYLYARKNVTESELNYYWSLEKGYEGELFFDKLIENLEGEFIVLNDLLFEVNNTQFQIDSLLISTKNIYLFDVKNYEGDYFIGPDDNWYSIAKKEIKNPIHQLKRCETLLKRLLQNLGYHTLIESNLIFINPHFHLYQAPIDLPIIFPTQIDRFLDQMQRNLKQSILTEKHLTLAEKLMSLHLNEPPYVRRPEYTFEQLRKGIYCKFCHSFDMYSNPKTLVCKKCGFRENIETAVLRNVEEYKCLFPEEKITTSVIYEWCKIIKSDKTIRKFLSKNYKSIGKYRGTYYVENKKVVSNERSKKNVQ